MRFLIMGAGAVGSLLGAQLHAAGHEVRFWVRPALRELRKQLVVQHVSGNEVRLEADFLGPGDVAPETDWVLVCVRSEQLDAALEEVVRELGPARNVAISAVSYDNVLTRARRHGLTGCVLAHGISFGSWRDPVDPARFHWFAFASPNMLSAEGERQSLPPAHELADVLNQAGSPTRVMLSARAFTTWMVAVSAPLIAGWDVCGFTLERLAREPAHRRLTARAIAESTHAVQLSGLWKLLTCVPAWAYALLLRALPLVIGRDGREVWLHHGPKIREQTRYTMQIALQNAAARGAAAPALHALAERFEQHVSACSAVSPSSPPRKRALLDAN